MNFDFNKGRKTEVSSPDVTNDNPSEKKDIDKSAGLTDREKEIQKLADPFLKFIRFVISDKHKRFMNLQVTKLSFNQARETVSKYSNEELINWLIDHDESEWVVKPAFYMAVYREMEDRLPERFKNKLK